jgi:peptide/nickel transport system substrate-binding protein
MTFTAPCRVPSRVRAHAGRSVLAVSVVFALALSACTHKSRASGEGPVKLAHGGTFSYAITTDPGNLDPLRAADQTTSLLDSFAYDTLINLDAAGKPVSELAEKWQATATSATFTLRKDVTCSDGSRLTASQVAANFDFIKDPASQSSVIGSQLPSPDYTTHADDAANTFTIKMKTPFAFLLTGAGTVPIVCAKGTNNRKLLAHQVDGTGPFTLVDSVASDHYTFAARKDYKWGPSGAGTQVPGFPDKVTFKVVQNQTTADNLLLSGQLNAVDVVGQEHKRLTGRGFQEIKSPGTGFNLYFNERSGHPGADPQVRRALAMAVDLSQLVKVLTENDGQAPTDMEPNQPKPCRVPTVAGNLPPHDAAQAGAILDAAGWHQDGGTRSKNGTKLAMTLLYASGTASEDAGMELVRDWWKALGVQVTLKPQDANAVGQTLFTNGGGWDGAVLGIGVSYPSQLVAFFAGPAAPDGQNFAAIDNPDYTRLSGQAGATAGDAGCQTWADAEKALFKRVDLLPLSIATVYSYGNKAQYRFGNAGVEPTSIRLLAS